VRARWETRETASNVARSRLRADLDETGGGLAPRSREREKERRSWKLRTHEISVASRESGISGNRHRGWVSVNDNRGTVTILYRREIRPVNLVCVCACRAYACGRRNRNLNRSRDGQQVLSRSRFNRASLWIYAHDGSTSLYARTVWKEQTCYITHPSPSSGDQGY